MEWDRGCKKFEFRGGGAGGSKQTGRILNHESFRHNKARQAPGRKPQGSNGFVEAMAYSVSSDHVDIRTVPPPIMLPSARIRLPTSFSNSSSWNGFPC
jgi:hypothetical protein